MIYTMKPIHVAIPVGVAALAFGGCAFVPPGGSAAVASSRNDEPLSQASQPQPAYFGPAPRYVAPPMIIYPPYPYY
jgi:hypothetical protein